MYFGVQQLRQLPACISIEGRKIKRKYNKSFPTVERLSQIFL